MIIDKKYYYIHNKYKIPIAAKGIVIETEKEKSLFTEEELNQPNIKLHLNCKQTSLQDYEQSWFCAENKIIHPNINQVKKCKSCSKEEYMKYV